MILEALAISTGLGAVALGVRLFRRRRASATTLNKDPASQRSRPRGLRVGDVLLHDDAEYWLAGALHLEEDGLVLRAFRCPGTADATWVVQLDEHANDLALCTTTGAVPEGAVPDMLPVGGFAFALRRRGRARVTVEGSDVPRGSNQARYVLLRGPGGRALVVLDLDDGRRLTLVGPQVERERIDLLPGGDVDAR